MAEPRSISTISVGSRGGRRSKFAASTVPLKPAPTMTRVLRIVNSTKRVFHSFANILQNSWSNSASNSREGQAHATQQINLLRGLRGLSRGDRRPGGRRAEPCALAELH